MSGVRAELSHAYELGRMPRVRAVSADLQIATPPECLEQDNIGVTPIEVVLIVPLNGI